jgi:AcrR family transcriptional regulator
MSNKKRNSSQTSHTILSNAKVLFSKYGFSATSMDMLANKSNINKAMIFYYFKNKQGLYEAVLVDILKDMTNTIEKNIKDISNPKEQLESFISTYATFAYKHPYFPSILLKELSTSSTVLSDILFENMQMLYKLFSHIIQAGKEQKYFYDTNPMMLYFMIIGSLNLMITTKEIRLKAAQNSDIDTCANYDIETISQYLIKKVNILLGKEDEN